MLKSKLTDGQIVAILAEQERGMATSYVCQRHGVSSAAFYKWDDYRMITEVWCSGLAPNKR